MSSGFQLTIFQYFPDQWGIFRLCTWSQVQLIHRHLWDQHICCCSISIFAKSIRIGRRVTSTTLSNHLWHQNVSCVLEENRIAKRLQPRRWEISWGPDNFHSVHLSPPTVHSWQKRKEDGSVDCHCVHHHLHKPGLVSSWEFQRQCCRPTWTQSRPEAEWGKFSTRYIEEIL